MRWIALPLLFLLSAGPAVHWGDAGAPVQAALLWSAGIGLFVVLAGWRVGDRGWLASAVAATCVAAIVNVPAYVAGPKLLATMPLDFLQIGCSSLDTAFGPAIKQLACGG